MRLRLPGLDCRDPSHRLCLLLMFVDTPTTDSRPRACPRTPSTRRTGAGGLPKESESRLQAGGGRFDWLGRSVSREAWNHNLCIIARCPMICSLDDTVVYISMPRGDGNVRRAISRNNNRRKAVHHPPSTCTVYNTIQARSLHSCKTESTSV